MKPRRKNPEKEAAEWNAKVKVGDVIEYRETKDSVPQVFVTQTPAEVLSGHTAVVWLATRSGCVSVSHCRVAVCGKP